MEADYGLFGFDFGNKIVIVFASKDIMTMMFMIKRMH